MPIVQDVRLVARTNYLAKYGVSNNLLEQHIRLRACIPSADSAVPRRSSRHFGWLTGATIQRGCVHEGVGA